MKILALDIGTRRTGIALADSANGVPVALNTLQHMSVDELVPQVVRIAKEKDVQNLVVGLPFLLSGEEGEQASFVRSVAEKLEGTGLLVELIDERYSTPPSRDKTSREIDPDSASACQILQVYLDRKMGIDNSDKY